MHPHNPSGFAWLMLLLIAGGLFPPPSSAAAADAFEPLSLEQALTQAQTENRPVFAHVFAAWSLPCQYLDRTTFAEADVARLLRERCIPIKIDGEQHAALRTRYGLDRYPTLLLLRPDGSEQDRWQSYLPARQFIDELQAALAGKDAIRRAQDYLEKSGPNDPLGRERLAEAYFRLGCYDDALREYAWCFDVALEKSIVYASARRQPLMLDLAALSQRHPPARRALDERRERLEQRIQQNDQPQLARNLALLNRALDIEDDTLRVFDSLPGASKSRRILFDHVFDQLVALRRFDDIFAVGDALETFVQDLKLARGPGGVPCCSAHARGPGSQTYLLDRAEKMIEVLTATGREPDARRVIKEVARLDDSPTTRTRMEAALQRGLHPIASQPAAP